MERPRTIVFDLDGTLYEDTAIFDIYAREMSTFLPADQRARFLADWDEAKVGRGVAAIGLGYDRTSDRLFHFEDNRITAWLDWSGSIAPALVENVAALEDEDHVEQDVPAAPIFSNGRFNIGDMWWLPAAIAAHHGLTNEQQERAFLATRAIMASDSYRVEPVPGVRETLDALTSAGVVLIALTNSPAETTADVLRQIGLDDMFAAVRPLAGKPAGMTRFLRETDAPRPLLSAGDNYLNDIAPALQAGDSALFIDRHDLGLGAASPRYIRVRSVSAMLQTLAEWT
jgi:FMN phosphatase YigB (HAD superfamily)